MRTFHCDFCGYPVYFEADQCPNCEHRLGFLPDLGVISALDPMNDEDWLALVPEAAGRHYRRCQNDRLEDVCNWMIPPESEEIFCPSCRLNRTIPNLTRPENRMSWRRLERAKRRLVYSLMTLGLPVLNQDDDPERGLAFDLLADPDPDAEFETREHVMTGHASGLITLNIAEADDAVRERLRLNLKERYRTLIGHFRHEVGHYYWELLIRDSAWLEPFRQCFGDEREDYGEALTRYYDQGPMADWQARFVSAYASSHAWEDWAESFAHYLHMVDTLETAAAFGLRIRAPRSGKSELRPVVALSAGDPRSFEAMVAGWFPLTFAMNNLNRSMGLADLYPFSLNETIIDKLRFVHQVVHGISPDGG